MSNHPTIAALREALESGREVEASKHRAHLKEVGIVTESGMASWAKCANAYNAGHEAATERLMTVLEQALDVIEFYADKNNWKIADGWNNRYYAEYFEISEQDQSRISDGVFSGGYTAREFLLSIRETVADASTLANASGEEK